MRSLKSILLAEIDLQCRFALLAYHDATSALKAGQSERFWYSLQSLVDAAARASFLLWPSAKDRRAMGEELRRSLSVPEESPLSPSRFVPSGPLDQLLVKWLSSVPHGEVSLSNFGSHGFVSCSRAHFVRCFDPDESAFVFLGGVLDCASLVRALAELQQNAESEIDRLKTIM